MCTRTHSLTRRSERGDSSPSVFCGPGYGYPPLLPVSPIVLDSTDDSVAVQVGSSREEIVGIGLPFTAVTDAVLLAEFLLQDLQ